MKSIIVALLMLLPMVGAGQGIIATGGKMSVFGEHDFFCRTLTDTGWVEGHWVNGELTGKNFFSGTVHQFTQTADSVSFTPITIRDLRLYLQDCYNDSTKEDLCDATCDHSPEKGTLFRRNCTDSTHVWWGGSGTLAIAIRHEEPRYYWTHRTPSLPGFYEFLKREGK